VEIVVLEKAVGLLVGKVDLLAAVVVVEAGLAELAIRQVGGAAMRLLVVAAKNKSAYHCAWLG
jgi:hypothetical protein